MKLEVAPCVLGIILFKISYYLNLLVYMGFRTSFIKQLSTLVILCVFNFTSCQSLLEPSFWVHS